MSLFSIHVYGDEAAAARLDGIALKAENARPAMEEIYRTILDIEDELFSSEGARGGQSKWAKLTLNRVVEKAKKKLNPKILHATDRLHMAMATYRSPDVFARVEKDKIIFQPKPGSFPGARLLFKGGPTGGFARGTMPARPFIRFTRQDEAAFAREIASHLMKRGRGKITVSFND